jgi:hypothetical protein
MVWFYYAIAVKSLPAEVVHVLASTGEDGPSRGVQKRPSI